MKTLAVNRISPESSPGVMHLVDTLEFGGSERAAVNYVNYLPADRYRAALCTTRRSGPLEQFVKPHVHVVHLNRRFTFDLKAARRLRQFIQAQGIRVLHAHGSTLFLARLIKLTSPGLALIWHLHYGRWAEKSQCDWRWALAARRADAAVTSNEALADWLARCSPIAADRIMCLRNMVPPIPVGSTSGAALAGSLGSRIVCVANFRPEKDHLTLLQAFSIVIKLAPAAHLYLIGGATDPATAEAVRKAIERDGLGRHVTLLGPQAEVAKLLRSFDIGVLSSSSEGLPMALLEYGAAGLPVIATAVGQIPVTLDHGDAGILVPAAEPDALAAGLLRLIESASLRATLARRFQGRVEQFYSPGAVVEELCSLYTRVLSERRQAA